MEYILIREKGSDQGVLGKLVDPNGNTVCYTCELPWLNNLADKSCIPTGTYSVIPHNSVKHPNTWEILNVPDRNEILFHNGNAAVEDSLGCILVGNGVGIVDGYPAVLGSVTTLNHLREVLPSNFTLTIK